MRCLNNSVIFENGVQQGKDECADEIARLKAELENKQTVLRCWWDAFGTSQLSHAAAHMDSLRDKLQRAEWRAEKAEADLAAAQATIAEVREWLESDNSFTELWSILAATPRVLAVVDAWQSPLGIQFKELPPKTEEGTLFRAIIVSKEGK